MRYYKEFIINNGVNNDITKDGLDLVLKKKIEESINTNNAEYEVNNILPLINDDSEIELLLDLCNGNRRLFSLNQYLRFNDSFEERLVEYSDTNKYKSANITLFISQIGFEAMIFIKIAFYPSKIEARINLSDGNDNLLLLLMKLAI